MGLLLLIVFTICMLGPIFLLPVITAIYLDSIFFPKSIDDLLEDTLQLPEHQETQWANLLSHQSESYNKKIICKSGCCEYQIK